MLQASPQPMDSSSDPGRATEPPAHSPGHKEGVFSTPWSPGDPNSWLLMACHLQLVKY